MNIKDISTQLLFSTAPIVCSTEQGYSTGTGFFYSHSLDNGKQIPFLITNHHVVKDAVEGYFEVNLADGDLPSHETIRVNFDSDFVLDKKLGELDLVAMPVAPILNVMGSNGKIPFFRSIESGLIPDDKATEQLAALEEITFIGYPSGLYDNVNKTPLIRQGTTATPIWNDYQGKKEFLIDASVFPGSSGSPAFIFNQGSYPIDDGIAVGTRLLFVGVVTGTIVSDGREYLDLGKVIKSSAIETEISKFVSILLAK